MSKYLPLAHYLAGLKQDHDFQLVFLLLMVPCYLYILYFAMRGHRAGRG